VRILELMQEIYALQQDSKSVTTFYSDLKVLSEELKIYLPMPGCTCRIQCACESMHTARKNHVLSNCKITIHMHSMMCCHIF